MDKEDTIGCLSLIILVLVVIAASAFFTYMIVNSNLPEWLKFWLT